MGSGLEGLAVNLPAVLMALAGLALGVRAALRTEIEDIRERASLGGVGLVLIATGIAYI
jgi:hypothetical protein